jgi:hypothetical protein
VTRDIHNDDDDDDDDDDDYYYNNNKSKGNLKAETESEIVAVQDQALHTK